MPYGGGFVMNKDEVRSVIIGSRVGRDMRFRLSEVEARCFSNQIKRASCSGYEVVLRRLYDDVYYFEKLKEGDASRYMRGSHVGSMVS